MTRRVTVSTKDWPVRRFSARAHAARLVRFLPSGVPRWVRVYDNGGLDKPNGSSDRYTVVFTGRYACETHHETWILGMSADPYCAQGICIHDSMEQRPDYPTYGHLGKKIRFADLPDDCRAIVLDDYRDLWDLNPENVTGWKEPK